MAKFNAKIKSAMKTVNLAGGEAYKTNPKFELTSILLTSFVQDQFYRSADDTVKKLKELIPHAGHEFAAKAAVYARREFGMRSITHVVGGEVAKHCKGYPWRKQFFKQLFKRPDDMMEVVAYYAATYGLKPLPNVLKRAIRERIAELDEYSLAKYKGEGKAIKMIDLVRLTHPKRNAQLEALVKGTLVSKGTWETKLTQAGQKAKAEAAELGLNAAQQAELATSMKAEEWKGMLEGNDLKYIALMRNVRNICEQAPDCVGKLCEQLLNETAIKKSLVFPFQLQTATRVAVEAGLPRKVINALNEATNLSVKNVPVFEGKTLICLDDSGSMASPIYRHKSDVGRSPIEIGSLFAATLYKANNADLLLFSDDARFKNYIPTDSVVTMAADMTKNARSAGTNFHAIFEAIGKAHYDRVIILSDMQGWMQFKAPTSSFNKWKERSGSNPFVYSFDLQGYGTLQLPEQNVFCMAGFSDKVFDVMKLLEQDRYALINTIEAISFE